MDVSKNNATPKWVIYNGKPYEQMNDLGGYHYFLETPRLIRDRKFRIKFGQSEFDGVIWLGKLRCFPQRMTMTTCARCVFGKKCGCHPFLQKKPGVLLLMVQKSGDHQLRLVVSFCIIYKVFVDPRWWSPGFLNHQQCDLSSGLLGCQMVELGDPPRWIR